MTKHKTSDERCEQILVAARACFLQHGYFATRVDVIARAAGLSKGGVYFHFQSKHDIFLALVQSEADAAMRTIDTVADGQGGLLEKLLSLGEHFTTLFATSENPRFMMVIAEMALRDEAVSDMLRQIQASHVLRMRQLLELGVASGELRQVDTQSVAFLLKALLDGIQLSYALGQQVQMEPVLVAAIELIMRGVARHDSSPAAHIERRLEQAVEDASGHASSLTSASHPSSAE